MSKHWSKYLKHGIIYAIAACAIFISGCRKHIELANGYTWKEVEFHGDTVIVNAKGEIVIEPGGIELWAKYPWIYGNGCFQKPFFAINLESGEVIHMDENEFTNFEKRYNISPDQRLWVNFCEATTKRDTSGRINTRGQELRKACMPNK